MPVEITMPQLSDTMTEGTVVKWRKKEGEKVGVGETIAEIETDKATMEQESYEAGTLAAIVVPEGQKVAVGDVIAVLAGAGEKAEDIKKKYAAGEKKGVPAPVAKAQAAIPEAVAPIGSEGDERTLAGDHPGITMTEPSSGARTATATRPSVKPPATGRG